MSGRKLSGMHEEVYRCSRTFDSERLPPGTTFNVFQTNIRKEYTQSDSCLSWIGRIYGVIVEVGEMR